MRKDAKYYADLISAAYDAAVADQKQNGGNGPSMQLSEAFYQVRQCLATHRRLKGFLQAIADECERQTKRLDNDGLATSMNTCGLLQQHTQLQVVVGQFDAQTESLKLLARALGLTKTS